MVNKSLEIESIVNLLIKIADKVDPTQEVSRASLHDSISVNDLDKLKQAMIMFDNIGPDEREILFVQVVSSIWEVVNTDLDKRNVAALIHLKVTLLKLLGYTASAIILLTVTMGLYTGQNLALPAIKDIWTVLETMFLK